jgi:DNA-binding response OmpR family regulator
MDTQARILFVDDEPNITITMPAILRQHGYDVTAVGTVNDALTKITSEKFDVLISDLNIGHPGDGFTVVSAMRRIQPTCVTLILTGYPGFDSALEAIRNQVDDYLIKPTPIPSLIGVIKERLQDPKSGTVAATKRMSQILRENVFEITQHALSYMKADPGLGALPITDEERIDSIPRVVHELAAQLDAPDSEQARKDAIENTRARALKRLQEGYTIPLLVPQIRLVEQAIYEVIHGHLLSLNLSYFMFDLKRLNASLSTQLEHMLLAFIHAEERMGRRTEKPQ